MPKHVKARIGQGADGALLGRAGRVTIPDNTQAVPGGQALVRGLG
jgi:hypothetical protein